MNLGKIVLIAAVPLFLIGCSTLKNINVGNDFEKDSKAYLQLVRWHELESAMTTYVSASVQEEYRKKITAAGEVLVVDYRVKSMECDPVKGEASLKAELDYYRPPSVTVKTVVDNQKWSYEGEDDARFWRLKTTLPDFK